MISRIGTVAVLVSDAQRSKDWYVEKLGFTVLEDSGHWVVVGPVGSTVGLHLCQMEPLEPGNTGITLLADDLEATYKTLKGGGLSSVETLLLQSGTRIWNMRCLRILMEMNSG